MRALRKALIGVLTFVGGCGSVVVLGPLVSDRERNSPICAIMIVSPIALGMGILALGDLAGRKGGRTPSWIDEWRMTHAGFEFEGRFWPWSCVEEVIILPRSDDRHALALVCDTARPHRPTPRRLVELPVEGDLALAMSVQGEMLRRVGVAIGRTPRDR